LSDETYNMQKSLLLRAGFYLALVFGIGICRAAVPTDGLAPLPDDTRPYHYQLSVTLDAANSRYGMEAVLGFEVLKPTRRVVVHGRDLQIDSARLDNSMAAQVSYDAARHQVTFAFDRELPAGKHELAVTYTKQIEEQVEGLFKVRYPVSAGGEKQMYFTFLCCTATGRHFMPLWDAPDYKATFDLQLIVPAALDAVSNMPVAKREELEGGRARYTFQTTPKMSSYLLFFAIGELERISTRAGRIDVGIFTQRGKAGQARFALEANLEVIGYYNDYFGVEYPLPKLDSIAFPGAGAFGAMENWGAIFYYEPYLLMDPALSTAQDEQEIYTIVAHEVAHQWFGNLVTTRGWDDLWLNEGFASWMATKASHVFHPEWNSWLHAAKSREAAMRLDARASTHPIVRKVQTLEEAELAFDEITYEKGSQVIRMIEAYVGEDAFRKAIREHMRKHAYSNAITDDLWKELEAAAPLPVTAIARDFTEQDGVPLIDVLATKCTADRSATVLTFRQSRFGLDAISKRPRQWRVPVTAAVMGSAEVARHIVRGNGRTEVTVPGCGPVKVNMGESSYYRTRYDAASFAQLQRSFEQLPAADQLGLLNDTYALSEAGYVSFDNYLQLAAHVSTASDPIVQLQLVRSAEQLNRLHAGLPAQQRYRSFAAGKLSALFADVGWTHRQGESANASILRAALIDVLAQLGDPSTLAEARRRFHASQTDPQVWSVETRKAILNAVGSGADAAVFDELAGRATRSSDTSEKRSYFLAASRALDQGIARRALELSLTPAVPEQLSSVMISAVADTHPQLAIDFAAARYNDIAPRLDSFSRITYVPTLAAKGVDRAAERSLLQFASKQLGGQGVETVERARSLILYNDEVRRLRLPQVAAWLKQDERSKP
jgi:aminopeptidase N